MDSTPERIIPPTYDESKASSNGHERVVSFPANEAVESWQRFTADNPCPVCTGHKDLPQHQGER